MALPLAASTDPISDCFFPDAFRHYNPSYSMDTVFNEAELTTEMLIMGNDLSEDDLLLTPPTVYGLGLSDRRWCEY